jgi:GTP cyclohydrolase I
MSGLSESAKLVKEALEQRGLETPMRPNAVSREEKKEKIEYHMREILGLLQLDLTDDSLEKISSTYIFAMRCGVSSKLSSVRSS